MEGVILLVLSRYCSRPPNSDMPSKFGLLLTSSYGPIRVYRVAAYRRCTAYSCGQDLVRYTTIPGFIEDFAKKCNQTFNSAIASMEYLNEDNIALMVRVTSVRDYNSQTGVFSGGNTKLTTLWLNPSTMAVKDSIWQTSVPSINLNTLCPGMQRSVSYTHLTLPTIYSV